MKSVESKLTFSTRKAMNQHRRAHLTPLNDPKGGPSIMIDRSMISFGDSASLQLESDHNDNNDISGVRVESIDTINHERVQRTKSTRIPKMAKFLKDISKAKGWNNFELNYELEGFIAEEEDGKKILYRAYKIEANILDKIELFYASEVIIFIILRYFYLYISLCRRCLQIHSHTILIL